ncbi:hypothetical protein [Nocardia vulneris]|nr:hypothetical protein [Nocardia vulneris]
MRSRSAPAGSADAAKTGMAATPSRVAWAYTQDSATRSALFYRPVLTA